MTIAFARDGGFSLPSPWLRHVSSTFRTPVNAIWAGAVLTALRARGVDREEAFRLSLLMSLPVAGGAAALTAVRGRELPPAVPTALAAVSAYAAGRSLRASRTAVAASVAYRLVVAGAVAAKLRRDRP